MVFLWYIRLFDVYIVRQYNQNMRRAQHDFKRAAQLESEGKKPPEVAKIMGIPRTTLYDWLKNNCEREVVYRLKKK